ncbi:hypothetical protein CEQ90_17390 [Lewinellaceae bacterium SD302]|nr:hypothetical protein CEQ90_17390 [Lewinellaceae bacterium SD302]
MRKLLFPPLLLFLALIVQSGQLSAQRESTLLGDLDLTGAWGGVTYNYSALGDDGAYIRGGYGGLEFGNQIFIGYGGWRIKDDVRLTDIGRNFELRHGGLITAYTPNSYKSIHPRLSFTIGPGRVEVDGQRDRVFVAQPAAGVELNLFQVFRLGIEGGYRYVGNVALDDVDIASEDVSSFFLQIEARFGFSW